MGPLPCHPWQPGVNWPNDFRNNSLSCCYRAVIVFYVKKQLDEAPFFAYYNIHILMKGNNRNEPDT